MQKKLLGMAVAAALVAPAVALAQVQVYGTANVTFTSTKYGEATPNAAGVSVGSVSKMAVNSHSSNFGIRSSETLGGGMTGWLQYEFNTQMERNNDVTPGNGTPRNTAVGLRGGFGNVYFGTWETPYASTFRMWDVGTVGGFGPTTSVAMRRESTGSAPSSNCSNILPGATGRMLLQFWLGEEPVDSRRIATLVVGPKPPTVPTSHIRKVDAYGVSHVPK